LEIADRHHGFINEPYLSLFSRAYFLNSGAKNSHSSLFFYALPVDKF
jgi:hypothetical protein